MHPSLEKFNETWFEKPIAAAKLKFSIGFGRRKPSKGHCSNGKSQISFVSDVDSKSVKNKHSSKRSIRRRFVSQPTIVLGAEVLKSLASLEHLGPSYSDQAIAAHPLIVDGVLNLDGPRSVTCPQKYHRQSSSLVDREGQYGNGDTKTTSLDLPEAQTASIKLQRPPQHCQTIEFSSQRSHVPVWLPLFDDDPTYPMAPKSSRLPQHSSSKITVVPAGPETSVSVSACSASSASLIQTHLDATISSIPSHLPVALAAPSPPIPATSSMPTLAHTQRRNSWLSVAEIIDTGAQRHAYGLWQTIEEQPAMLVSGDNSTGRVVPMCMSPGACSTSSVD